VHVRTRGNLDNGVKLSQNLAALSRSI
jgi:hypothetical protein